MGGSLFLDAVPSVGDKYFLPQMSGVLGLICYFSFQIFYVYFYEPLSGLVLLVVIFLTSGYHYHIQPVHTHAERSGRELQIVSTDSHQPVQSIPR